LKLKLQLDRHTALLVDEHPLWLDAVARVLERIDVTVVAASTSPQHALALLEERSPELVVIGLDGHESDVDALTFLRSAREQVPHVRAIVLSAYRDPERVEAALQSGAVAYVVKTVEAEDLAYAMRQAFAHSVYVAANPATATQPWSPPAAGAAAGVVTRRETDILRLVAEGHSNAEVARTLWIAEQTVKFHLSNIYRKLHVSNRTEAARWAQLHGLLAGRPTRARADLNVA
jgi:DNA-binding NarL/FixJ family response regulator